MSKQLLCAALLLVVSTSALSSGKTSRTPFTCGGAYQLWEVFWIGASTIGEAALMEGENNLTWSVKVPRARAPAGAMAPATNNRWYRVRSQTLIPFRYTYTSMCWVPQQRCSGRRR